MARGLSLVAALALCGCGNTVVVEGGGASSAIAACDQPPCAGVETVGYGPCECDGEVVRVTSSAELAMLSPGQCGKLAAGQYGDFVLPSDIDIVGDKFDEVFFGDITVEGVSSVCQLTARSVVMTPMSIAVAKRVHITGSTSDGLVVDGARYAHIVASTIDTTQRYGISAFDTMELYLSGVRIDGTEGPGLWASCGAPEIPLCECPHQASVTVDNVIVDNSRVVGINLQTVSGTVRDVTVRNTAVGNNFEAGGGLAISHCASIDAGAVVVEDSADFGVLIHESAVQVAAHGARQGLVSSGNLRGVVVIPGTFEIHMSDMSVVGNGGMGISLQAEILSPQPVYLSDIDIADTHMVALPHLINGVSASAVDIGDGLHWSNWAAITTAFVSNVTISGSARHSIYIGGNAKGSLDNVELEGAIVQQCGSVWPQTVGSTPPVQSIPCF
jgi:hypothetical protein